MKSVLGPANFFLICYRGSGQEKEELKLVENGRIGKKEEEIAGFKKGEFRCIQAAGYCHASCLLARPF